MSLLTQVRLYLHRQASSLPRYLVEQILYLLIGWIPTIGGVFVRGVFYCLILHMHGWAAIERNVRLRFASNLFLGHGSYIDEQVYLPDKADRALRWARESGIKNWGYFIIGLPGETEETIRQTIDFSKQLPLDIALFHVAAPYPGTPFFFEVVENGWFRQGTRWEQVDMDQGTVLDYPGLSAERLLYWQKRAFREWAMRPGPMLTYLTMLFSDTSTFRTALNVGLQHISWAGSDTGLPVS